MKKSNYTKRISGNKIGAFLIFCLLIALPLTAQESLNSYYSYPLSIGVAYQRLSNIAFNERTAPVNEITLRLGIPLPFLPVLKPFVLGGVALYDSDEQSDPTILDGGLSDGATMPSYNQDEVWDHLDYFGGLGIGVQGRLSKEFELGADAFIAFGSSYYGKRVVTSDGEWYPVGESEMVAGLNGELALNPSYNMNIQISPSLRYMRSLGNFHDYDGLYFGIGLTANYRFGEDPDAPRREIKSIQFGDIGIDPLYSAMQSYYSKNPFTSFSISNTDNNPVTDVEVYFYQAGFMDTPTLAAKFDVIESGESVEVDLLASFNQEIFSLEGITPLSGEVIVSYNSRGRAAEQTRPVSYDLYDKTSITWDDDEKVSAFITPADGALRNYTSFIRQSCKEEMIPMYNKEVQFAAQAFQALKEIGIIYQPDPTAPFTKMQENTMVVDSISLPRDSLKRISGDCDDLTVLYCSLLETVGIETGFITVPGHIYAVFNTKEQSSGYRDIHSDRALTISLDGELWVPVEITMIGKSGFLDAWRKGAEEWTAYEEEPARRNFYRTAEAQLTYRPVGLKSADLGLQYGDRERIAEGFSADISAVSDDLISDYKLLAEQENRAKYWNRLGIAYARFNRYREAEKAFGRAINLNGDYLGAKVNTANLQYLRKDYPGALNSYLSALATAEEFGKQRMLPRLLLNISRTYHQLKDFEHSGEYYARTEKLSPETVEQYAYLSKSGGAGSSRASEQTDLENEILFMDGE